MTRLFASMLLLFAGLSVRAEQPKDVWRDSTPAGLKVECLCGEKEDGGRVGGFRRGRWVAFLRYRVTNPTSCPQAYSLRVYTREHYRWRVASRFPQESQYLQATGVVPAGTNVVVELCPPAMEDICACDQTPRLVDASGENASVERCSEGGGWSCDEYGTWILHSPRVNLPKKSDSSFEFCCSADWSRFTHWAEFAGFQAVVFTADEWKALPDPVRETLVDYEAAGGLVVRDGKIPDAVRLNAAKRAFSESGLPEAGALSKELQNRVPLPAILLVMLAFALTAGPALVFVLARRGRRIHILWVFPLVSLAFTVVLTVVVRLSVGTELVRREFVSTKTVGSREVRHTSVVLFAPSAAAGKIEFPADAFVYFDHGLKSADVPRRFEEGGRSMDLSQLPPLWPVGFDIIEVTRK